MLNDEKVHPTNQQCQMKIHSQNVGKRRKREKEKNVENCTQKNKE